MVISQLRSLTMTLQMNKPIPANSTIYPESISIHHKNNDYEYNITESFVTTTPDKPNMIQFSCQGFKPKDKAIITNKQEIKTCTINKIKLFVRDEKNETTLQTKQITDICFEITEHNETIQIRTKQLITSANQALHKNTGEKHYGKRHKK